jgi:hypothetical protein
MWSLLSGFAGLLVGAYVGADLMSRAMLSYGTVADRLVGKLRIDAMLLRFARDEGLTLEKSPTAQSLVREAEITMTTLGGVAGDFHLSNSASEVVKLFKELDANPLVKADASSERGVPAKVARDCLIAELPKPRPDYASCAANVGAAYKVGGLPVLASK